MSPLLATISGMTSRGRSAGCLSFLCLGVLLLSPVRLAAGGFSPGFPQRADEEALETKIRKACTQCHEWTPPEILPKKEWPGLIQRKFNLANITLLQSHNKPIWDIDALQVASYFRSKAPAHLDTPRWTEEQGGTELRFSRRLLPGRKVRGLQPGAANVRLLELFPDLEGPELVVSDMISGWVSWTDPDDGRMDLQPIAKLNNPCHAEAVDLDRDGRTDLLIADLGWPKPTDQRTGSVAWLRRTGKRQFEVHRLVTGMGRVADVQAADFDGDQDLDVIAAEFGWRTVGGIHYLENGSDPDKASNLGAGDFRSLELDDRAGAIHVPIVDLDRDGRPDFLALLSQEHEAVVAFLNRGPSVFEKKTLFTAPHPHWGSSGLEVVDLDQDGDLDVLFTHGDTLDAAAEMTPYHGLSWLENSGDLSFVHHWVDIYYGALRADAGDLDGGWRSRLGGSFLFPQSDRRRSAGNTICRAWPGTSRPNQDPSNPAPWPIFRATTSPWSWVTSTGTAAPTSSWETSARPGKARSGSWSRSGGSGRSLRNTRIYQRLSYHDSDASHGMDPGVEPPAHSGIGVPIPGGPRHPIRNSRPRGRNGIHSIHRHRTQIGYPLPIQ